MKTKLPSFVAILILTTVTSVMWISLGIYHSVTQEAAPSVSFEVLEDINPSLDKAAIEKIKNKNFIRADEVPLAIITITTPTPAASSIPTPNPTEVPLVSPQGEESQTPTPEGGITP